MGTWLVAARVADIFQQEMAKVSGSVTRVLDGESLFARGVLPRIAEVVKGDGVRAGVAVRATEEDIFVHPFIFRLVCTNGAIMAQATQTVQISRHELWIGGADLETRLCEAVRGCCQPEAFQMGVNQMRTARQREVDMAIMVAQFMATHGSSLRPLLSRVLQRYDEAGERSAYGMMNAITSVARDTRNPNMKWKLEELGGSVPALMRLGQRGPTPNRAANRGRQLTTVG